MFELFDENPRASDGTFSYPPIREDQLLEIREALDAAALTHTEERRAFIESCVQRPTERLRDLRATDVRFIVERLRSRTSGKIERGTSDGTAWELREEDTWIDRL